MSLRKHPRLTNTDGKPKWVADYRDPVTGKRRQVTFATRALAEDFLAGKREEAKELAGLDPSVPRDVTVKQ